MKYTNESLKQQASEDFTNINEDEPFTYTGNLATQYENYEKFEQENTQSNENKGFDFSKNELYYGFRSENTSSAKVVKVSCLSSMKQTVSSHESNQYNIRDMSPGIKFQQRRDSKINSNHMKQFLFEKYKTSNSCDKIKRNNHTGLLKDETRK